MNGRVCRAESGRDRTGFRKRAAPVAVGLTAKFARRRTAEANMQSEFFFFFFFISRAGISDHFLL